VPRTPLSRLRAGSGSSNQSQIAPRAVLSQAGAALSWTSERADTLFVCERVRKAAAHERQPQRAERAMYKEGGDMLFSSPSDDEVGVLRGAIRVERA
jgi:hypothetical protein